MYESLTKREIEVLLQAAQPLRKDIAKKLVCSEFTICSHITHIYQKLNCTTRAQALIKALKLGIIKLDDIETEEI